MSDSYRNWVTNITEDRSNRSLVVGEMVQSSSGKPFKPIEFVTVDKKYFVAELGKKGSYYIYHFYPSAEFLENNKKGKSFYEHLVKVLVDVFKNEDQIELEWVNEMRSWAVRVNGWMDNIWGDDLAVRVIHKLDDLLLGKR